MVIHHYFFSCESTEIQSILYDQKYIIYAFKKPLQACEEFD